jgi:hypothetical protein
MSNTNQATQKAFVAAVEVAREEFINRWAPREPQLRLQFAEQMRDLVQMWIDIGALAANEAMIAACQGFIEIVELNNRSDPPS